MLAAKNKNNGIKMKEKWGENTRTEGMNCT